MRGNPLRNTLIRLLWDPGLDPSEYVIAYKSRGAEGGYEVVRGSDVVKVYLRGFEARSPRGTKYIPFHRIIYVKNENTGEVLYQSRRPFT